MRLALFALLLLAQGNGQLEVQLQRAIQKEMTAGDLKAAIDEYKKIASRAGSNRAVAAKALLRLAEAYEKQGGAEARKTYERIVTEYGDQGEATQARNRLAALGGSGSRPTGVTMRQFYDPKTHPNHQVWNMSADGRYAGATDYSTFNAAVIDLVTGKSWNVTDYSNPSRPKSYIDQTAISRDGKQIAFWHYEYGAKEGQLRVVGADGKNERTLYHAKGPDGSDEWGMPTDWSPDGSTILMQVEGGNRASLTQGITRFLLVPAAGGAPRVLKTAEYTRRYRPKILFSPDGRYVAYDYPARKELAQGDIFIQPVEGGAEAVVAPSPARETMVGWAPDGSILFLSDRSGTVSLYRVPIKDGKQAGEPELLRAGIGEMSPLGVARNGSLYYSHELTLVNTYTAVLDFATGKLLSAPQRITESFTDYTSTPSWSPDGRKLAYLKHRQGGGAPTLIIRQDGTGEERELLPAVRLDRKSMVRWHLDDKSLLAIGTKNDTTGLFRIDASTGQASLIQDGRELAEWSPDGKWTFQQGGDGRKSIIRTDTVSGEEKAIHTGEGSSRFFRVSPDGQRLVFLDGRTDPKQKRYLSVVSTDGGAVSRLFDREGDAAGAFTYVPLASAWAPDARYILCAIGNRTTDQFRSGLWIVPADGGQPLKTDLTTKGELGELSVHPDGKRIAYSVSNFKMEFWVMENFLPASK